MFDSEARVQQTRGMDDTTALRATAHPLRLRMLSLLTGTAASAAEVARELGVTQANASYHLRLLERAGLVRVVEEVRVRGGVARRYRHESSSVPFTAAELDRTVDDAPTRQHYIALLASALQQRSTEAVPGPRTATDAELWVTPGSWRQVVTLVGEASALLHAAAAAPRTEGSIRVSMTAALFPMAPGDPAPGNLAPGNLAPGDPAPGDPPV
jgi:DNA-binding transcriptional ArsR family regulator